jgi:hypothetical protein
MMSQEKKNLILHITSDNYEEFRDRLELNEHFNTYYDGSESTLKDWIRISTRFYYYDIPHEDLTEMLRYIQEVREGVVMKVKITKDGNADMDERS